MFRVARYRRRRYGTRFEGTTRIRDSARIGATETYGEVDGYMTRPGANARPESFTRRLKWESEVVRLTRTLLRDGLLQRAETGRTLKNADHVDRSVDLEGAHS